MSLYVSLSDCLCLSLSLSVSLSDCLCLSLSLSLTVSVSPSVCLSVSLSLSLSMSRSRRTMSGREGTSAGRELMPAHGSKNRPHHAYLVRCQEGVGGRDGEGGREGGQEEGREGVMEGGTSSVARHSVCVRERAGCTLLEREGGARREHY